MEFFEGDPASLSKEEGRIFKHTEGKGPVEVPVFAKTESKQFPVLKEVSAGVYSFVQKSWDKGGGQGYRITSVLQVLSRLHFELFCFQKSLIKVFFLNSRLSQQKIMSTISRAEEQNLNVN
eukprot:TRINITY_DN1403_c0_g1_i2.p1 TRINITY_DN1403_c0_g1~~TRINITY_DN1403_c0_g1_i2.p1  ORF type:complete len:130 (-),score=39.30 TRINITY_DN1403_c0_g1_i2:342-704(-)